MVVAVGLPSPVESVAESETGFLSAGGEDLNQIREGRNRSVGFRRVETPGFRRRDRGRSYHFHRVQTVRDDRISMGGRTSEDDWRLLDDRAAQTEKWPFQGP